MDEDLEMINIGENNMNLNQAVTNSAAPICPAANTTQSKSQEEGESANTNTNLSVKVGPNNSGTGEIVKKNSKFNKVRKQLQALGAAGDVDALRKLAERREAERLYRRKYRQQQRLRQEASVLEGLRVGNVHNGGEPLNESKLLNQDTSGILRNGSASRDPNTVDNGVDGAENASPVDDSSVKGKKYFKRVNGETAEEATSRKLAARRLSDKLAHRRRRQMLKEAKSELDGSNQSGLKASLSYSAQTAMSNPDTKLRFSTNNMGNISDSGMSDMSKFNGGLQYDVSEVEAITALELLQKAHSC